MPVKLKDYQRDALAKMHNGCILNGGVGSGKSITSIAYYFNVVGQGQCERPFHSMRHPLNLYIITTARKRDEKDWEKELLPFLLLPACSEKDSGVKVTIDSWNNIKKYISVTTSFFIFDEQRVVGKGQWVKSFLKITRNNKWILLSATPGDSWTDYVPVFIANGYFKTRTEFERAHVVYNPYVKFPVVQRYLGVNTLVRLRNMTLVDMDYKNYRVPHHFEIKCEYDKMLYDAIVETRKNPYKRDDKGRLLPIVNASEYCYTLRKVVNSANSRLVELDRIYTERKKCIVFYNFDYELDKIKQFCTDNDIIFTEWNGHIHEELPDSEMWLYLVQYTAGAEGWNCITTDTIIFYSMNYSYKTMTQSCGRIDRLNSPFLDLYYYHLMSDAKIDIAIRRANSYKKNFNEGKFLYGKIGKFQQQSLSL